MRKNETRESVILINDEEKIFGVLHRPQDGPKDGPKNPSEVKCPAILVFHGFGGQKTGRYRFYVSLAEELAKKGIAVFRFDFRGCGDSEGDFLKTTLKTQISDALKAIEFLKNDPKIDKKRIGLFGRSLGGAIAVMAASRCQEIKSLALFAPLFSPDPWRQKWHFLTKSDLKEEELNKKLVMNGQSVGFPFLKELFELDLEKELGALNKVPLLHMNAGKDQVITLEHVQKYQLSRKKADALTEFMNLENSDHDCSQIEEREKALNKIVSWFLKTL